ncbi:hypothetical protein CDAR_508001 [Caerostris darwini]|uniref:Uncharacterized protein n=1 Tax=Caerostris darwini TaxID=1538125 RepID=A0AAV4URU2_9ARAC|nr:hypothetical protein CDAR_508001 [Caerostris darwini]
MRRSGEGGPVFYLPSVSERMIRDCPNPIHAFSSLNKETQASKEFRLCIFPFLFFFSSCSYMLASSSPITSWKGDLPHFKSPDNIERRQEARDKEISSYHLNLQSEGS